MIGVWLISLWIGSLIHWFINWMANSYLLFIYFLLAYLLIYTYLVFGKNFFVVIFSVAATNTL